MAKRQRVTSIVKGKTTFGGKFTQKPFKISSPKSKFFKPKTRLYYTPAELGALVIIKRFLLFFIFVVGIWIILLWGQGSFANSECRDRCDYGGCISFMYPHSFWLMPSLLCLEALLIYFWTLSRIQIREWIWK